MRVLDRCGALTGAAYVLLVGIGGELSTSPGPQVAHPTGQQDIAGLHWLTHSPWGQVGVMLELLGFAAALLFIGYLTVRLREGGWLAAAALAGGVAWVAVKLASAAPMLAAYLLRDEMSPETARMLFDTNGAAFVLGWLPAGVFIAGAAGACLVTRTVGRILGWGGVVVGTATVAATAITGVHVLAANPLPFLFGQLWILLVSVRLAVKRTAPVAPSVAPDPVPVPV